ncbi:dipeptide/oligopeptide/nickel ABC transporter permease/ATP-binding protein [Streptomyces sp. NPDC051985]|uniref:dipeptide/oligopeptide/nickel ABC transporter permease/ATP-binding protein n=1 Tax=Streptomyces sp. NPDC051985 TaxID=3155807 RepID=UPI0034294D94
MTVSAHDIPDDDRSDGVGPPAVPRRSDRVPRTLTTAGGIIGGVIVLAVLATAVLAPVFLTDRATAMDPSRGMLPPSFGHPFGTDALGRDIALRVLVAARLTLLLSLGALVISSVGGILCGIGVAMLGQRSRRFFVQVTSAAVAFPAILLAVLLAGVFGRSGLSAMLGLGAAGIPPVARLALNLASSVMESEHMLAARIVGVRRRALVTRHLLPNIAEPLATVTVVSAGQMLLAMSALSFVGIGVQEPSFDWGMLLAGALKNVYTTPMSVLGPALAIVVTGVGFNLLGEALASGIDPRARALLADARRRPRRTRQPRPVAVPEGRPAPLSEDIAVGIDSLVVTSGSDGSRTTLVDGVGVTVRRGEKVAIVGESGSGKTLTLNALAGLVPTGLTWTAGRHQLAGRDLTGLSPRERDRAIGARLPMIFQDPMGSLNPARRVGSQLVEKLRVHAGLDRKEATERAAAALEAVGIDRERMRQYPHQFSGGMRQRVVIAMATLLPADVILADEPTTALDVSVQAQVITLLRRITEEHGSALVLVSHDLALVSQVCERIIVMYRGRIVEEGPTEQIVTAPRHPYTRLLLGAIPDPDGDPDRPLATIPRDTPADVTDLAAWEALEHEVHTSKEQVS